MRKYFPVIASFMVFTGFLAVQVIFNIVSTSARQADKSGIQKTYYDNVFKKRSLVDWRGEKLVLAKVKSPIVVVNFWASWCAPCLVELPSLAASGRRYGPKKMLIVGVNTDEVDQIAKIKKLTEKYNIDFPIIPDRKGEVLDDFMVSKIPTTLIFHKGRLVKHIEGTEDFVSGEMIDFLDALLKE